MKYPVLIITLLFFALPGWLMAASVITNTAGILTVTTNPEFPKPNESVTVGLISFDLDLNTANITWSVNGKVADAGIGMTNFTFKSGDLGKVSAITTLIETTDGKKYQKTINVNPSGLGFIWQADTYTPPFYMGKSLFTNQSRIKLVAVPQVIKNGSKLDPSQLVYQWTLNNNPMTDQSGYGKQTLEFDGNYWGRDDKVSVSISDRSSQNIIDGNIELHPNDPVVKVYEDNPLLGITFNQTIGGRLSIGQNQELSFFAVPFFFINSEIGKTTNFNWTTNGKPVENQGNGNSITFRSDSGAAGLTSIGISVSIPSKNHQAGSSNFAIEIK